MSDNGSGLPTRGGIKFRLGSIPISMPWSGLLGVLLIAYLWTPNFSLDPEQGPPIGTALVFAVLFYACVLLHELGHAAVAKAAGYPVHGIVLWVLGGYTSYERKTESSWREGLIAAAGPATSLLLGLGFSLAETPLANGDTRVLAVVSALAWSNTVLGIYNALPGLPLDGGSVLKSIVWGISGNERRGTIVAAWSGRVVAVLAFAVPIGLILHAGYQPNVTAVIFGGLIAVYLFAGANQALKQSAAVARVPTLSVAELTRRTVQVARDLPVSEALRAVAEAQAGGFVVVDPAGNVIAVGQEDAVRAVPEARRPWVPVSSVSRALNPSATLLVTLTGRELLAAMQAYPAGEYLVIDEYRQIVGLLATSDVQNALSAA